jgi:hypothetical protein
MNTFKRWLFAAEEIGGTSTASVAGAGDDSSTVPVFRKKKKRKIFDVPPHVWRRFKNNERIKYERWNKYLGSGLYEDGILNYIKDNKNVDIIIRDQVSGEVKNLSVRS